MGILVDGAQKVEEGVEHLKTNLQEITRETRARAEPRLKASWKHARNSLDHKGGRFRPVRRRFHTIRHQLRHHRGVTLDRAETRARMTLKHMIENAIDELEKMKRSLERESDRVWHAA